MSGGQVMAVLIVAIVMIASIIRARYGYGRRRLGGSGDHEAITDSGEARQLRDEVKQLKERLAVLERITVEKENSLEREIEKLRDK